MLKPICEYIENMTQQRKHGFFFPACLQTPKSSPLSHANIGASKTRCIGHWMLFLMKIKPACAPKMHQKIWPSSINRP